MQTFVDIFLKLSRPLHKAALLMAAFIVILVVDQFTSYPSLSFTKDKYETIDVLIEISQDQTAPIKIRQQALRDIEKLSQRESLRHYTFLFLDNIINIASNAAQTKPPIKLIHPVTIISVIKYIISWFWFMFCAGCIYVFVLVFMYKTDRNAKVTLSKSDIALYFSVAFMIFLIAMLSIVIIDVVETNRVYTTAFLTQVVVSVCFAQLIKLFNLLKTKPK